jgi:tripartite-type tricarboxylate transporter receptor subunit TctC
MTASMHDHGEPVRGHGGTTDRRRFLQAGVGALAAPSTLLLARRADAAGNDPMRILCSGPAGSVPDLIARAVADQLWVTAGLRALVDNRPGAAGQISVGALKGAAADGSTLLLAQGAVATLYPHIYPKLTYAVSDLEPVSTAGEMTLALAVGPAVPASVGSMRDLMAWMRSQPRLANVGSPGTGTLPHLLEAMLMREAGTAWQHIAYSGGPPAVVALLGGQIAALVLPEGLFSEHRTSGRLRVLATSGAQRTVLMPDVPTLVEQGYADLVVREWFAFFMSPRVSPRQVVERSKVLRLALAQSELAAAFANAGIVSMSSTPEVLSARIATERRLWEPIVQALDVRVE